MSFDLVPKFLTIITDAGERQQNEPGANAVDNCGPACGAVLMMLLGYADIEPQVWIDTMPGTVNGIHGGTTPEELNTFIAGTYSNPPWMQVLSPPDIVDAILRWGILGQLAIVLVHSDSAGHLDASSSIGHYVIPLACDGFSVTFWNPDWGIQTLGAAAFAATYAGLVDLCTRPILGSSTATAVSEVQVMATIDDVYQLLKDVNGITLLRVEGRVKDINEITLLRMEGEIKALQASVAALTVPATPAPVDLQPVLDAIHNLTLKAS